MKRLIDYFTHLFLELYSWIIDVFSFNSEVENMVEALNHKLEEPPAKLALRPFSHPGGFIRELGKRRISMAGAYIKIARDLSPEDVEGRLAALRILAEQSLHAKTINMPLNTARVQIDLMKDAVKSRGNKRAQMECISDFGLASFGQEAVIRNFLNKRNLVEVPEEDLPLRDLKMGWDDHVHDTLSEGRKTPTQVLLDAFVKGISELTIVYSNIDERRMIHEAIEAGQILGVKVNIGIEFSVGIRGGRRHYMFVPPVSSTSKDFFEFFDQRKDLFEPFHQGLRKNAANRRKTMAEALDRFNTSHRMKFNLGYEPESPCYIHPLKIEDLDRIVACGQVSRVHIAELLFQRMREIFQKRVLFLKAQVLAAEERFKRGIYSEWELKNISSQYESVREQFVTMTPEVMRLQYLDTREVHDYDSVFADEETILPIFSNLKGKIVMIHPLEIGLKDSMLHVLKYSNFITHVETINLHDSVGRNPNDLTVFNKFIYILNNRTDEELITFFEQHGIFPIDRDSIGNAKKNIGERGIIPVCGSDSTGRDPTIPGMGFIKVENIPEKILPSFKEHHFKLPRPIADLIIHKGKKNPENGVDTENSDIICMGKLGKPFRNKVGDEEMIEVVDLWRFWTYLNPTLKEFFRSSIGFIVAYHWIGFNFAMIWLGITFTRNVLVDIIAASGLKLKAWSHKNINFDNVSQSLFWTGFSVPILDAVQRAFLNYWTLPTEGLFYNTVKFFFICFANGLYISTHNRIRNFDRRVIRANFFRSVLSWPFATAFHFIGDYLNVPAIVQAKFWSDFVAGIIEGSGKYRQRYVIRKRDLIEILPKLDSSDRDIRITTMLDIIYIWAVQPRGLTCLEQLLVQHHSFWERGRMKKNPEETKRLIELYHGYHQKLLDLFGDPGCMNILSEFVLKNYIEADSVTLTNLIGVHCESFLSWLRNLKKKTHPHSPNLLAEKA